MAKLDFDPNAIAPRKRGKFDYATFIPDRSPQFKVHENRGHALNAFHYRSDAILYRKKWQNGQWEEVFRIENALGSRWNSGPTSCALCGTDVEFPRWAWVDRDTNSPKYLPLCKDDARTEMKKR